MNINFTDEILNPSLQLIKTNSKIKKFYYFPWLLSVIFLSVLLVYQVIYTYVELLWNKDALLGLIFDIFHSTYISEIIIVSIVFVLCYIILIPIFEWALIRYVDQESVNQWDASRTDSLGYGIFRFYALFEFNNIFNMFKLASIINWFLFSLRFLWLEYFYALWIFFFIAFLFSILLNILIAYAKYEIVLENKWVFEAIGVSSQIALLNIKITLKLYILMFVMNIKVFINFFIFLIFPVMAVFVGGLISSQIFAAITFFILIGIFVFFILILWYISAVLDVFTTSIWYNAYKAGKRKLPLKTESD